MQDVSYSWVDGESHVKNITLRCAPPTLTCILGPVGSGKSSLLNVLLGELKKITGTTKLRGSTAYVPQVPFIIHGTVRDNVLFGLAFDEKRYKQAIEVCALQPDIDILVSGDQTMIGERGIDLSGGQKARVALARAVYSDADIVLLDDPLSAVDAHVGHKLFHDCIRGVLKHKTVLLVTHQLQFVTLGEQLVFMKAGEILHSGTPKQLREQGIDVTSLLDMFNEQLNAVQEVDETEDAPLHASAEKPTLRSSKSALTRASQLKSSNGHTADVPRPKEPVTLSPSPAPPTAKKSSPGLSVYKF